MRPLEKPKRKWCWGRQLPKANERLDAALELVRGEYFSAQVLIAIPATGELVSVDVVERGKRLEVRGRAGSFTVAPRVFWSLMEAARKADRQT